MSGLAGRVALVTGAARRRGIGRGIAEALAARGCAVAVNDVAAAEEERELVDALGPRAAYFEADVSDRAAVEAMLDAIEARLGPVDIACSNAGVAAWEPFAAVADATLDRLLAVNLTAGFNVAQAAARRMVARGVPGRIVFTSSVHVQMPFCDMAVYGATKQGLRALAETMALELGPHGITVNHLGPGWVKSDLNDASPGLRTEADERATLAQVPAGRAGEPADMGRAVAYLCGQGAAYVTGEFLRVDGGYVVGKY
jgi:NAD(P)-dependent dehydrogenase (short-subunit alcohol dehydrogenase family)